MAVVLENNLYPPILNNTFNPAFLYDESCRVYFALSEYNNQSELKTNYEVQITVQDLKTNKTVLNKNQYPSGIKINSLLKDNSKVTNDKYYIELSSSDIEGSFKLNKYYKVQLRLTAAAASTPPSSGGLDKWLSDNIEYFSEWSTVTLIYGISEPTVALTTFNSTGITQITQNMVPIAGKISFDQSTDTEELKSYQIKLIKNNNIIEESQILYPINKNEINYTIKSNIVPNQNYSFSITFVTLNLYTFTTDPYNFIYVKSSSSQLTGELNAIPYEELGKIQLIFKSSFIDSFLTDSYSLGKTYNISLIHPSNTQKLKIENNEDKILSSSSSSSAFELKQNTNFIVRRSSNKDNFNSWQEIYNFTITASPVTELILNDYTIEPGVWYKYLIIKQNQYAIESEPCMAYCEDIFLSSNGKQLRIRFDPQVNSFSVKTSESIIETIGSPYPFIRRNGNTYYKTFSLSGLITQFTDTQENLFMASEEDFYSSVINNYQQYKDKYNIVKHNQNFIYQKDFREAVIKFLYADDIKLFRSTTEGNILVALSNINLTPNNSLSRLVYSFSCTVYEIDQANYKNFIKYSNKGVNII